MSYLDVSNSQLLEEEAQQSWRDLAKIGREQERLQAVRAAAQAELETSKTRASTLEQVKIKLALNIS
jgi:ABC-type enterochelin transport system substrate-binding protein